MPEFLSLVSREEAMERYIKFIPDRLGEEQIRVVDGLDRTTCRSIFAPYSLPSFDRSSMDGYAIRSLETQGASVLKPIYFKIIGEINMGQVPTLKINQGEAALIHTGGMLPQGADAVIILENTQRSENNGINIFKSVNKGENIIKLGEDVTSGELIIQDGSRLRAAEIGGLMALGITQISVSRRPKVAILSTGDEVVSPESSLLPGQVHDVNTYTISALVVQAGGIPVSYGIIPDDPMILFNTVKKAHADCDIVVICAGSSASYRDFTADIVNKCGKPGVLVHGINIRPGKPTILGICDNKPVLGLPGNPVSAYVIFQLFLVPVIHKLLGRKKEVIAPQVQAILTINTSSSTGREEWIPVHLTRVEGKYQAEPIFFKSNFIFSISKADGIICVPPDANGLAPGSVVSVFLTI